ncbi:MAG: hypothetical protein LBQ34_04560 [Alphaproteobacteria bacterium]|jgi:hypothetical protein|nr:hypothetical protein [Alphaproteobacteria bacterium]
MYILFLEIMRKLQPLDIIFRYTAETPLDTLIAECGLNYGDTLINHVGLVLDDKFIIEANKSGVVISSATDFMHGKIYVKRLNFELSAAEIDSVLRCAKSYLNKEYNFDFIDSEDSIYCSELIIRAFEVLGDNNPFSRHPITFNNHISKKLDARWLTYYGETHIPEGEMGSHPASLFANPSLVGIAES